MRAVLIQSNARAHAHTFVKNWEMVMPGGATKAQIFAITTACLCYCIDDVAVT